MTKDKRQLIHDILSEMSASGSLTPDAVIAKARAKNSPLHECFEWDVEKASFNWLRQQARQLISSFEVEVHIHETTYKVGEFVEIPNKKKATEQGYISVEQVKDDPEQSRQFIAQQLAQASSHVAKTKNYAAVLGLTKRVSRLHRQIDSLRSDIAGEAVV